jgi:hypothetical protein
MASSALLKKEWLEDFKQWMKNQGWQEVKKKSGFEVYRAKNCGMLFLMFANQKYKNHYTTMQIDEHWVKEFMQERGYKASFPKQQSVSTPSQKPQRNQQRYQQHFGPKPERMPYLDGSNHYELPQQPEKSSSFSGALRDGIKSASQTEADLRELKSLLVSHQSPERFIKAVDFAIKMARFVYPQVPVKNGKE